MMPLVRWPCFSGNRDVLRIGMPVQCGKWRGRIWKIRDGHVISLETGGPGGLVVDYKVHLVGDLTVVKGVAHAPRTDLARRRIARSWEAAD